MDFSGRETTRPPGVWGYLRRVYNHPMFAVLLVFSAALLARLVSLPDEVLLNPDGAKHQLFAMECAAGGPCLTDLAITSRLGLPHGGVWTYVIRFTHWVDLTYMAFSVLLCVVNALSITALFGLLRKSQGTTVAALSALTLVFLPESLIGESQLFNPSLLLFVCILFVLYVYRSCRKPNLLNFIAVGAVASIAVQLHLIFMFFFLLALIVLTPGLDRKNRLLAELGALWGLIATWLFMSPMLLVRAEMGPTVLLALLYLPSRVFYAWLGQRFASRWPWRSAPNTPLGPLRLMALVWALFSLALALVSGGNLYYTIPGLAAAPLLVSWGWKGWVGRTGLRTRLALSRLGVGGFLAAYVLQFALQLAPEDGEAREAGLLSEPAMEGLLNRIVAGGAGSFLEIEQRLWAGNQTDQFLRRLLIVWRRSGRESAQSLPWRGQQGKGEESPEICLIPEADPANLAGQDGGWFGQWESRLIRYRLEWRERVLDLTHSWTCVSWDGDQHCACRPRDAVNCSDADVPAPGGIAWSCLMDMGRWPLPQGERVFQVFPIVPGLSKRVPVWVPPATPGGESECRGLILSDSASGVVTGAPANALPWTHAEVVPGGVPNSRLVVWWEDRIQGCEDVSGLAVQNKMPLPVWGESPARLDGLFGRSEGGLSPAQAQNVPTMLPQSCEQAMAGTGPELTPQIDFPRQERFWVRPGYVTILVVWTMALLILLPLLLLLPNGGPQVTSKREEGGGMRGEGGGEGWSFGDAVEPRRGEREKMGESR